MQPSVMMRPTMIVTAPPDLHAAAPHRQLLRTSSPDEPAGFSSA
jgi:hypothetical protein